MVHIHEIFVQYTCSFYSLVNGRCMKYVISHSPLDYTNDTLVKLMINEVRLYRMKNPSNIHTVAYLGMKKIKRG